MRSEQFAAGPDLAALAQNLAREEPGYWRAHGHEDLKFIESDPTDWLAIEESSFWYQHRNRLFTAIVDRLPPEGTFFEIGAGNAPVSFALQKAGYEVVAIEPTVRFAKNARQRGVREVVCSDLETARFIPGALGAVGMFDVLEHIRDDLDYLRQVRSLMPRGGLLYCAVPAWDFLWSREDEAIGHVRRYSLARLNDSIMRAGFSVCYQTYYFAALLLPILLLRAIPSRLGIRPPRSTASTRREHVLRPGLAATVVERWLAWELGHVQRGGACTYGASCFVVARAS